MSVKIVKYKTAKLAKEKGFDENNKLKKSSNNTIDITQDELRTWLRDTHQIFIEVKTDCTSEPKFCFEINVFKGNPRNLAEMEWGWYFHKHDPWYLYYTYEDALEDALLEGVRLIGKDLFFDS